MATLPPPTPAPRKKLDTYLVKLLILSISPFVLVLFGARKMIEGSDTLIGLLINFIIAIVAITCAAYVARQHQKAKPYRDSPPTTRRDYQWAYTRLLIIVSYLITAIMLLASNIILAGLALLVFIILLYRWWTTDEQGKTIATHLQAVRSKHKAWWDEAKRVAPWVIGALAILYGIYAFVWQGQGWFLLLVLICTIAYAIFMKNAYANLVQPERLQKSPHDPLIPKRFTKGLTSLMLIVIVAGGLLYLAWPFAQSTSAQTHEHFFGSQAAYQLPGNSTPATMPAGSNSPSPTPAFTPTPTPTPVAPSKLPIWQSDGSALQSTVYAYMNALYGVDAGIGNMTTPAIEVVRDEATPLTCGGVTDTRNGGTTVPSVTADNSDPTLSMLWCPKANEFAVSSGVLESFASNGALADGWIAMMIANWYEPFHCNGITPGSSAQFAGWLVNITEGQTAWAIQIAGQMPPTIGANSIGSYFSSGVNGSGHGPCPSSI